MANNVNYAQSFEAELQQKYKRELMTGDLTTDGVRFLGAKTIRMPVLTLSGFADHGRDGGFNRKAVSNDFITKTLEHDRDVEFFVDAMDVDETNAALSAANITNAFDTEFAIPETDAYRFSKLYGEYKALGGSVDTSDISGGVLEAFDRFTEELDEAEVPEDGRVLYITPQLVKKLKNDAGINRFFEGADVNRAVRSLDGVKIIVVPQGRMKTAYTFADGFTPASGAGDIRMILIHPSSVVAVTKHSYIKLWEPGQHTAGDGYLYQNRQYGDLFVINTKLDGIKINASK